MRSRKFREIWNSADSFYESYTTMGIPVTITETNCKTLFYLLYAKFGNSHLANRDEVQGKLKIFSTIFKYGPAWETRLSIQKELQLLDLDDLREGSKQITNHANNPNTAPSDTALTELEYIDEQHAVNYKKNKVDAYASLWNMIATDVTEEFLSKFTKIFMFIEDEEDYYLYEGV